MTTSIRQADLIESVAAALQYISYYHPADYITHLARAYEREQSAAAKDAIAQILTNSKMSATGHRPICQDTGIVNVFLKVGMDVRWDGFTGSLEDAINEGVRQGYNNADNKLRASVVADPLFARKNTGDNTPAVIYTEIVPGNTVDVTTVKQVKADLRGWQLTRCLFVGDAGMVSESNLEALSRGAGHAMGAERRGDKAHLRTRVEAGGMDYKGYNIAVHELGHNVEQTFSLYDIDHTLLAGVPNTAFTEALAFLFQARDLELLGRPRPGGEAERLRVLDASGTPARSPARRSSSSTSGTGCTTTLPPRPPSCAPPRCRSRAPCGIATTRRRWAGRGPRCSGSTATRSRRRSTCSTTWSAT